MLALDTEQWIAKTCPEVELKNAFIDTVQISNSYSDENKIEQAKNPLRNAHSGSVSQWQPAGELCRKGPLRGASIETKRGESLEEEERARERRQGTTFPIE